MLDLSKLTSAPWFANRDGELWHPEQERHAYVADFAEPAVPEIRSGDPAADAEFCALARNAFHIMLTRRWTAIQYVDKTWGVQDAYTADFPKGLGGQSWPNQFTALVEADQWYRQHVEAR